MPSCACSDDLLSNFREFKKISLFERHIFRAKYRIAIYRGRPCSGPLHGGSSMNSPPSPTDKSTKCAHRLEQSLTCLAPGVSGAALPPVHRQLRRSEPGFWGNESDVAVKVVEISSCTSFFTSFFTLPLCNLRGSNQLQMRPPRNVPEKIHQNGRERPHFFGSEPPKKFLRSLPPVSSRNPGCTRFSNDAVNAALREQITTAFTFACTPRFSTNRLWRKTSSRSAHGLDTSPKHCSGLERPHFVA